MTSSPPTLSPFGKPMGCAALATLCGLMLSACTTAIPIRTSIEIDASRPQVFAVLTEFAAYPEWNPYHVRVVGEAVEGADLEVRVKRPDGKVIDVPQVHVLRVEKDRALYWGGGISGIFKGEHRFDLEDLPGGGTLVRHEEDFEGLFIGFADLPPDVLAEGYREVNRALKAYVEASAP
ncbi:SRPBCC family protein [Pyruvatibacter mobilis]|uniref:SRPBCC family protein n=1 Tax=Pyruvatibacter mobilis TaxID=1712261 RepID=UPI003BACA853